MVLIPNPKQPFRIGDISTRSGLSNFKAFHNTELTMKITPAGSVEGVNALSSTVYQEFALINQNEDIFFEFNKSFEVDTIVLGKTDADYIDFVLYDENGTTVSDSTKINWLIGSVFQNRMSLVQTDLGEPVLFGTDPPTSGGSGEPTSPQGIMLTRGLAPGMSTLDPDDQQIIFIQFPSVVAKSAKIRFWKWPITEEKITLHKILFCIEERFPEPKGFKYPRVIKSSSNFTVMNIVYGHKWPASRVLELVWDKIDDFTRRQFEAYFERVQNYKTHYILAIGDNDWLIPPMFTAASEITMGGNKRDNALIWDGPAVVYRQCG